MSSRLSAWGNALVVGGAVVGAATVTAIAAGTEITLTPAMIQLLVYKGLAAASIGLIVAGSWIGRRGRQQEREANRVEITTRELGQGAPAPYDGSARPASEEVKVRNSD